MSRRIAAVLPERPKPHRIYQYVGPPPQLPPGIDPSRHLQPTPAVLMIEAAPAGVFLFRLTKDGDFAGDTWHTSVEDALRQVAYEYDDQVSEWMVVPDTVPDVVQFAVNQVQQRSLPPGPA